MANITADTKDIIRRANRLIKAATGNNCGDGMIVMDIGVGYSEPGYGDENTVWVTGNWNPKTFDKNATLRDKMPFRLYAALTRIGVQCEWSDEWETCGECYKLLRTVSDSYSWKLNGMQTEDGVYMCADCLIEEGEDSLTVYINNADRAVTWCDETHLNGLGWSVWVENAFEIGFHSGQDANLSAILESIRENNPNLDVIFLLDSVGQFDVQVSVYTRPASS